VLGALLGNIEFIKNNVDSIFILIVLISVVPIVLEFLKARREKKARGHDVGTEHAAEVTQKMPRIDS
jgi:membrane-associated protein